MRVKKASMIVFIEAFIFTLSLTSSLSYQNPVNNLILLTPEDKDKNKEIKILTSSDFDLAGVGFEPTTFGL